MKRRFLLALFLLAPVVLLPFSSMPALAQSCSVNGWHFYDDPFGSLYAGFIFYRAVIAIHATVCDIKPKNIIFSQTGIPTSSATLAPAQSPSGSSISLYGLGSEPVAYADLNHDGNPDLAEVETSNNGGEVTVRLLDSAGNVISTNQYPISSTTINDIVVGDFNGDGFPDLAVADDGGQVAPGGIWILINNGDGTFKAAVETPANAGPYHLFAADFNGDGNTDIAASNDQSPTVSVFFGQGNGKFQPPTALGKLQGAGSVVAADFRGTGRSDIAVIDNVAGSVVIFPANADTTFQQPQSFPAGYGAGYLIYADLNNDGIPDLAAAYTNANSVRFLINNGKGSFTASPPYLLGAEPSSLAIQPLGGGSFALLSVDDLTQGVLAEFGPGDGTLVAPQSVYVGLNPTAVAVGDVNGDGKDDAVVLEHNPLGGSGQDAVYLLINAGNGTFASPVTYSVPSPNAAVLAALTPQGRPDLVVASGSGNVEVLSNNDQGGFNPPVAFAAGSNPVALVVTDLSGDGTADVAVANAGSGGSAVLVLFGTGRGNLGSPATYLPNQSADAIAAADLNNDGRPDLIVATGDSGAPPLSVTVLMNGGSGDFTALAPVNLLPADAISFTSVLQIAAGDFNGDGKIDVAVLEAVNSTYKIQILLGNGDGTFVTGALLPTEFGGNALLVADVNGDGPLDLIVGHCCGETDDTYLLGNGDGTFQREVDFPAGATPQALALADWNGSGKAELAIVGQILQDLPGARGYFLPLSNSFPPAVVSSASFSAGALAPSEIVTLKGNLLASSTTHAPSLPLPKTLGGATVTLTDSAGNSTAAPLYYASPTQINLEVPVGLALGQGNISLTQTDGTTVIANVQFANIAPGIFQLNSSSLAAAQALVVNGAKQTLEQVYQLGPSNSVIPLPINLSQGQVYLQLYGTGIRNASNVTVTVGGQNMPILYTGPQGAYDGEDQVNVGPLPASLAGRGSVNIVLKADGQAANTVNVTIQ
jgi:uncharacterized protein (TIGR03437 family)